jgi:hypothetical protein
MYPCMQAIMRALQQFPSTMFTSRLGRLTNSATMSLDPIPAARISAVKPYCGVRPLYPRLPVSTVGKARTGTGMIATVWFKITGGPFKNQIIGTVQRKQRCVKSGVNPWLIL